ncbi:MAG: DoxX family protein [Prevotellaceae bacterium]|nr:DoxX family protein [Prevotellaceae bacterium]
MKKTSKLLSFIVAAVFLVSGIGKSLAVNDFSQILALYGFGGLRFFASFIIIIEVALGLLLFFGFRLKQTALVALCFVAALSAAYLYGYLFANLTDCGCFGYFSFLNLPPVFTFIRNLILICALLYVFLNSNNSYKAMERKEIAVILCILCAVSFVAGYTCTEHSDATQYIANGQYANKDVENTILGEFSTFSQDSAYLVFVFSYSCPHCYNSVENLKEYEQSGMVDRIVGLSFTADTAVMNKFNDIFKPNFQIKNYHHSQLFQLTNNFPVSYYISNNRVKLEIRGILPCWYVLLQKLQKMEKRN